MQLLITKHDTRLFFRFAFYWAWIIEFLLRHFIPPLFMEISSLYTNMQIMTPESTVVWNKYGKRMPAKNEYYLHISENNRIWLFMYFSHDGVVIYLCLTSVRVYRWAFEMNIILILLCQWTCVYTCIAYNLYLAILYGLNKFVWPTFVGLQFY